MRNPFFRTACLSSLLMMIIGSCTKNIAVSSGKTAADRTRTEQLSNGNQSVTGGGTTEEGGELSTFTFNAVKKADGTVTGQLIYHIRVADIDIKLNIDCLNIVDNLARMTGNVTHIYGPAAAGSGFAVGDRATFIVKDNGEGKDAAPDEISDLFIGDPTFDCEFIPDITYLPMSGNIQIHN